MATPNEMQQAKEIMMAYIQSLGTTSSVLFPKAGSENTAIEQFEGTWVRILKTLSSPDQSFRKQDR
jgi:hypothetical protein